MMPTPYPLEEELGMRYYASDTPGIGGRLRSKPEDFIVEEIPLPFSDTDDGPYLICRLSKTNWELQRAVKEIAKRLGISHRRIAWAGTKDKNAVTTQFISIYDLAPEAVGQVHLKDISLEVVGQSQHPLTLGGLVGNRFDITIRDCIPEDLAARVQAVTEVAAAGIPNYYGLQRFGVVRPVTHIVGEKILNGDYEAAAVTYIGRAYPLETEEAQGARTHFAETRDARAALAELPVQMTYERAMANHLVVNPGDYAGALRALPPKLLSLLVSAFQSYLFTARSPAVSMRHVAHRTGGRRPSALPGRPRGYRHNTEHEGGAITDPPRAVPDRHIYPGIRAGGAAWPDGRDHAGTDAEGGARCRGL